MSAFPLITANRRAAQPRFFGLEVDKKLSRPKEKRYITPEAYSLVWELDDVIQHLSTSGLVVSRKSAIIELPLPGIWVRTYSSEIEKPNLRILVSPDQRLDLAAKCGLSPELFDAAMFLVKKGTLKGGCFKLVVKLLHQELLDPEWAANLQAWAKGERATIEPASIPWTAFADKRIGIPGFPHSFGMNSVSAGSSGLFSFETQRRQRIARFEIGGQSAVFEYHDGGFVRLMSRVAAGPSVFTHADFDDINALFGRDVASGTSMFIARTKAPSGLRIGSIRGVPFNVINSKTVFFKAGDTYYFELIRDNGFLIVNCYLDKDKNKSFGTAELRLDAFGFPEEADYKVKLVIGESQQKNRAGEPAVIPNYDRQHFMEFLLGNNMTGKRQYSFTVAANGKSGREITLGPFLKKPMVLILPEFDFVVENPEFDVVAVRDGQAVTFDVYLDQNREQKIADGRAALNDDGYFVAKRCTLYGVLS
ncbi:MAG: hypothetical protein ABIE84_02495 [bacterium]